MDLFVYRNLKRYFLAIEKAYLSAESMTNRTESEMLVSMFQLGNERN